MQLLASTFVLTIQIHFPFDADQTRTDDGKATILLLILVYKSYYLMSGN